MELYYNTNGLAHHRLEDALDLLVAHGYAGISLTPDVGHLDPEHSTPRDWQNFGDQLRRKGLRCTLESGARYALDPARKHFPNLVTASHELAERRIAYYAELCRRAELVGANVLSLWSGAREPEADAAQADDLLLARLPGLLDTAAESHVTIAFEPEPGMQVDSLARLRELRRALGRDDLGTTIDLGHLAVTETAPYHSHLEEWADSLRIVHVDDCRRGVHQHLPLGDGELDFATLLGELRRIGFHGPLAVELSRDSHRAPEAIAESAKFLAPLIAGQ